MINEKEIFKEYFKVSHTNFKKARLLLKKLNYKNSASILSSIATTYLHEGKYRLAERYATKAIKVDYLNSPALWILARINMDNGKNDAAIFCFQEIIRIGTRRIDKCGINETLYSSLSRINDSKLQLYFLLRDLKPAVSKRYFHMYEKGIINGIGTLLYKDYEEEDF